MKQDRKRISKEKHEIAYNRKLAKIVLKNMRNADKDFYVSINYGSLERICKSLIKYTNGYTKRKGK